LEGETETQMERKLTCIPREQNTRGQRQQIQPKPSTGALVSKFFACTAPTRGKAMPMDWTERQKSQGRASAGKHDLYGHSDKSCLCFVAVALVYLAASGVSPL